MVACSRRSFLEKLGLGAGAAVLSPSVTALVSEARGAPLARKRFVVMTYPNGGYWSRLVPREFALNLREWEHEPAAAGAGFTMPPVLAPLEPFRSKLLLVDGLVNRTAGGHFAWTLLTGVAKSGGENGSPGGKSIDQHLAPVLGRDTLFPSVHLGSTTGGDGRPGVGSKLGNFMYAKGPGQPVPVQLIPQEAFRALFPLGAPAAGAADTGPRTDLLQRRKLLDWLSDDVKRVRGALAAPERGKLDEYLGALEAAQKRLTVLEQQGATNARCAGGAATFPEPRAVEPDDIFEAQVEIAIAALACGVTNVVGVSFIGIGTAFRKRLGLAISLHEIGHGRGQPDAYITWFAGQAAKLAGRLAALREGDRTMLDNTLVLFANDNNESHHSRGYRAPVALIGGAGGGLRADGRYVRYPALRRETAAPGGPAGMRPVADLLSTLSHALGAPVDDWGKGGPDPIKGPLAELLT